MIVKGASCVATGFVVPTTVLLIDDKVPPKVWIADDFRVRALELNGFQELDLLYIGDPRVGNKLWTDGNFFVTKSALAIWCRVVVLGHDQQLTFWRCSSPNPNVKGWN
jgi:hypothetical protein